MLFRSIRSTRDGDAIVDRTSLQFQDNYKISPRAYGFGRLQYLRDAFKSIDYLISPTAGVGYKVLENAVSTLTADVAVGAVTEKNPGLEKRSSGAITAGEKAVHKLSTSATLTQSLAALWKMSDFGDSLVTFQAGLATDITPKTQLKVDFLDTPSAGLGGRTPRQAAADPALRPALTVLLKNVIQIGRAHV